MAIPIANLRKTVEAILLWGAPASLKIARYLARNRRLEREMAVVNEVARIVTSTLDIQQVYDEFAAQLKKLVDFDHISLAEIDRPRGTFQITYSASEGLRAEHFGKEMPLEGSRTNIAVESGKTFIANDVSDRPIFVNDGISQKGGIQSCIFMPLPGKDGIMGTLNLFSTKNDTYGQREQAILEILAKQIAPAVENARLFEESITSQRAFQDSDARFRKLTRQAADPLFLSEPGGRIIDVNDLACQGLGYTREELLEMRTDQISLGRRQPSREEVWTRLLADEIVTFETSHRRKDRTTFPVEVRMSVIELDGRPYRSAIARDITDRKRAQENQMRWAQENSVMAEIGRIISSSLDLTEGYQPVSREIQTLVPFQRINLAILQPDRESFLPGWILGASEPKNLKELPIPLTGTMAGRVVENAAPVMFEADNDQTIFQEFPGMTHSIGAGLRSFLSVPLISRGQVFAVLQFRTKEPKAYSERHLNLAVRIGNQMSGAIAAARLFDQQRVYQEEISASLREKEVLMKEINHRVKNNLQIISSLLNLQSNGTGDPQITEVLQASQGRIRAMATIHEKLYQSEDLAQIDFGAYLKTLAADMRQSYGVDPNQVDLEVQAPKTLLGVDSAIPCGLIVNELVANSLKHAFPAGREGIIRVGISTDLDQHHLTIWDNGVGLPDGLDYAHSQNLGLRLVNAWVEQLGGTIELRKDSGVEVTVSFSEGGRR